MDGVDVLATLFLGVTAANLAHWRNSGEAFSCPSTSGFVRFAHAVHLIAILALAPLTLMRVLPAAVGGVVGLVCGISAQLLMVWSRHAYRGPSSG
jgi:hypothetical protein